MRRQPLIIGAGPAGCAAAITLGRGGHPPIVLERATGAADKVCGDFLSADTIERAESLGVDLRALGAAPIERVRLVHHARRAETVLPFSALGLSRRALDHALLEQARRAGAAVRMGQPARQLRADAAGWSVRVGAEPPVTAPAVFLATGKHDLRELPRRSRTAAGAIGLKMYYHPLAAAARHLEGITELTLLPGGYAGLQLIEHDRLVLCVAMRPQAFKAANGWNGVLASLAARNRATKALLAEAQPMLPRPLAVANIPYGFRAAPTAVPGLFRIGDQGAVIPSLTGDGLAIALHSGASAAEAWLAGDSAAASIGWQKDLARRLAPPMRLAAVLHRLALDRWTQDAAAGCAALFPGLLGVFARRTRLPDAGPRTTNGAGACSPAPSA